VGIAKKACGGTCDGSVGNVTFGSAFVSAPLGLAPGAWREACTRELPIYSHSFGKCIKLRVNLPKL